MNNQMKAKEMQRVSKHLNLCLTSLVIGKMQI